MKVTIFICVLLVEGILSQVTMTRPSRRPTAPTQSGAESQPNPVQTKKPPRGLTQEPGERRSSQASANQLSKTTNSIRSNRTPMNCSNIPPPNVCCPSFPKLESKEFKQCNASCSKRPKETVESCLYNCFMTKINATTPTGDFRTPAIGNYFASLSKNRNNKSYVNLALNIAKNCTATANNSSDKFKGMFHCMARQLFLQCPDKINNTVCNKAYNAAINCASYPCKCKDDPKNSPRILEKQIQGGNSTTPKPPGCHGSPIRPSNSTNVVKAVRGTAPAVVSTTTKPYTGPSTTHASQSANGVLGKNGPSFRDV